MLELDCLHADLWCVRKIARIKQGFELQGAGFASEREPKMSFTPRQTDKLAVRALVSLLLFQELVHDVVETMSR